LDDSKMKREGQFNYTENTIGDRVWIPGELYRMGFGGIYY